jgi:exodeoxyribonuclease-3
MMMNKKKNINKLGAIALFSMMAASWANHAHAEEPQDSVVRVMTYNVYQGGMGRKQPLSQTAKVIQEAKADVVGLQEIHTRKDPENAEKLAQLLGWNRYGEILTRYEIVEEKRNGIKVKLPSGQHAYIFNLHLSSNPYQPYQLMGIRPKFKKHRDTPLITTEAEAIEGAKKARGTTIRRLVRLISGLEKEAPVFVVGDFNEPSHLDWTERAAKAGRHPIKVEFPSSLSLTKAGFTDAYRTIYPDEMEKPGFTWSPIYKSDDPRTHHDRIDFVYFKGKGVKVTEATIVV